MPLRSNHVIPGCASGAGPESYSRCVMDPGSCYARPEMDDFLMMLAESSHDHPGETVFIPQGCAGAIRSRAAPCRTCYLQRRLSMARGAGVEFPRAAGQLCRAGKRWWRPRRPPSCAPATARVIGRAVPRQFTRSSVNFFGALKAGARGGASVAARWRDRAVAPALGFRAPRASSPPSLGACCRPR